MKMFLLKVKCIFLTFFLNSGKRKMHVWTVSISLSGANKSAWKIVLQVGCRLLRFVPLHSFFVFVK